MTNLNVVLPKTTTFWRRSSGSKACFESGAKPQVARWDEKDGQGERSSLNLQVRSSD